MTIKTERRNFIRGVGAAAASTAVLAGTIKWDNAARLYEQCNRKS